MRGSRRHSGYFDGKVGHVTRRGEERGVRGAGRRLDSPVAEPSVCCFDCGRSRESTPRSRTRLLNYITYRMGPMLCKVFKAITKAACGTDTAETRVEDFER